MGLKTQNSCCNKTIILRIVFQMFSSFKLYFVVSLHISFYIYYIPDYTDERIVALAVNFFSHLNLINWRGKLCVYYEISTPQLKFTFSPEYWFKLEEIISQLIH